MGEYPFLTYSYYRLFMKQYHNYSPEISSTDETTDSYAPEPTPAKDSTPPQGARRRTTRQKKVKTAAPEAVEAIPTPK